MQSARCAPIALAQRRVFVIEAFRGQSYNRQETRQHSFAIVLWARPTPREALVATSTRGTIRCVTIVARGAIASPPSSEGADQHDLPRRRPAVLLGDLIPTSRSTCCRAPELAFAENVRYDSRWIWTKTIGFPRRRVQRSRARLPDRAITTRSNSPTAAHVLVTQLVEGQRCRAATAGAASAVEQQAQGRGRRPLAFASLFPGVERIVAAGSALIARRMT